MDFTECNLRSKICEYVSKNSHPPNVHDVKGSLYYTTAKVCISQRPTENTKVIRHYKNTCFVLKVR